MKPFRIVTAGALAAATLAIALPSPAHAAATVRCYPGRACLYYNSNQAGAVALMYYIENLPTWEFTGTFNSGTGNGDKSPLKNNAASADSRYTSQAVRVHYNSWYKGAYDVVTAQSKRNLSATYNQNASWNYHPNPV
ncbi:hypothetical protein [Streptomyces sp. AP-93]|uniref:hypothetical protein n=1 Tax=Streptomyces sp. AP-93 TaxID=2929048 RepID=UPI001FAF19E2|nr:hypothetical protein [Streptomyces sp. AP-93]MCJ0868337.1 hypothetical protein [Streptomyces sp. AP-93]